ncbi:MAG: hypothetical protein HY554_19075 [Elusimicrobia bacterium]|nr:hypothetical protein [Elusimicrobiota bacterium]
MRPIPTLLLAGALIGPAIAARAEQTLESAKDASGAGFAEISSAQGSVAEAPDAQESFSALKAKAAYTAAAVKKRAAVPAPACGWAPCAEDGAPPRAGKVRRAAKAAADVVQEGARGASLGGLLALYPAFVVASAAGSAGGTVVLGAAMALGAFFGALTEIRKKLAA